MDLRELRYFVAVAEAGSLTAAAAELHMSQPPLSVAIQKLEQELGTTLLVRTSRGVEPTSAGRYLLDAASRVLTEVDDILLGLRRFGDGSTGTLRLAAVPALMWHRVPRMLREFASAAPDVEIRLVDPTPWAAIDMVHRRQVDAALVMVADGQAFARRHGAELDTRLAGRAPLVAALPLGLDAPDPFPLRSFDGATLALPAATAAVPSLPEVVTVALQRANAVPARTRSVSTIQAVLPLIEAGVAWGIVPDPDGASLNRFLIERRAIEGRALRLDIVAITRRGAVNSDPALARLIDLAVDG